jgi:hypothetical protein
MPGFNDPGDRVKREQDPISDLLPRLTLNLAELWDGN